MKLQIIWFVSSFLFIQNVISQDSLQTRKPEQHKPVYSARIYLPGTQNFTANLMDIKDSSIFTWQKKTSSPDPFHKHSMSMFDEAGWEKYDYKVIQSVKIRKKTLRAILIGSGAVIGALSGWAIGTNKQQNGFENAGQPVLLAFLLGTAGALTGLAMSSAAEKKYLINGDWKNLDELRATLKY
jgi:hypothetical protein